MRHLCTRNRPETDAVIWATKGQGLYANDTYQRLQLKLVPYGTMSTLKEKPLQTMSKSSCVVQGPAETFFQVSAPKLDLEKLQGLAVPFFHVGQTTEPELAARPQSPEGTKVVAASEAEPRRNNVTSIASLREKHMPAVGIYIYI